MKKHLTSIMVTGMILLTSLCYSQQFSYTPKNPAFGGDSFNYNWMITSANAQNGFRAPVNANEEESELDQFGERLRNQILTQISRTLLQEQIDSLGNLTQPGSFTIGDLAVDVFESNEGLVINIFDTTNGEQTQVIIPNE